MKKTFTQCARYFTLLVLALMSFSTAWGADPTTVTKTMSAIVEANGYSVSSGSTINTIALSLALDDNITISTTAEGNSGSFWGTSSIDWRHYEGAQISLTAKDGYIIQSFTLTFTVSNNGVLKNGTNTVTSGTAVSVNSQNSLTYTVGHSSGSKNGQIRITEISVTYSSTSSSTPSVTLTPSPASIASGESSTLTANATNFSGEVSYQLMSSTTQDGDYTNVDATWTDGATTVSPNATTYYKVKAIYNTEEATSSAVCVSVVQKYTITITQPSDGGTLTVTDGTNSITTGSQVALGTSLTCEVTNIPRGKRFSRFYAYWTLDGSQQKYKATNPATFSGSTDLPTSDVDAIEVQVSYKDLDSYTLTLYDKGEQIKVINGYADENILQLIEDEEVETPESTKDGYTFRGWASAKDTDAPEIVDGDAFLSANTSLYAVYGTGGAGSWAKITETSEFTAGTYAIISYDDAYYLPNVQATSNPTVTAVTTNNNEIVFTDAMKWIATTSESGLQFESYSTDGLYLWGGSANDAIRVNNTSTKGGATKTWTAVKNDTYGVIAYAYATKYLATYGTTDWRNYESPTSSNRAANFWKYTPGVITYDFEEPTTGTITIGSAGITTFYVDHGFTMPEGLEGAIAYWNNDKIYVSYIYDEGDYVQANNAIIIKGNQGEYIYNITTTGEDEYAVFNDLKGTLTADDMTEGGDVYYRLSKHNGKFGFYWGAENGAAFKPGANKAYIALTNAQAKAIGDGFSLDEATGITEVAGSKNQVAEGIFNLAGVKVGADYKGIVIVNGKKMVNK